MMVFPPVAALILATSRGVHEGESIINGSMSFPVSGANRHQARPSRHMNLCGCLHKCFQSTVVAPLEDFLEKELLEIATDNPMEALNDPEELHKTLLARCVEVLDRRRAITGKNNGQSDFGEAHGAAEDENRDGGFPLEEILAQSLGVFVEDATAVGGGGFSGGFGGPSRGVPPPLGFFDKELMSRNLKEAIRLACEKPKIADLDPLTKILYRQMKQTGKIVAKNVDHSKVIAFADNVPVPQDSAQDYPRRQLEKLHSTGFVLPAANEEKNEGAVKDTVDWITTKLSLWLLDERLPLFDEGDDPKFFDSDMEAAIFFSACMIPHLPRAADISALNYEINLAGSVSAIAFHGIGQWFLKRVFTEEEAAGKLTWADREASAACPVPEGAEYVIDCCALAQYEVRPGFERYGAAIFFDVNGMPLAVWVPEEVVGGGQLVAPPERLTRSAGAFTANDYMPTPPAATDAKADWEFAVWRLKCSIYYLSFACTHLVVTHWIVSNSLSTSLRENLEPGHPLRKLMWPFTHGVIAINAAAIVKLASEQGAVVRFTAFEPGEAQRHMQDVARAWKYESFLETVARRLAPRPGQRRDRAPGEPEQQEQKGQEEAEEQGQGWVRPPPRPFVLSTPNESWDVPGLYPTVEECFPPWRSDENDRLRSWDARPNSAQYIVHPMVQDAQLLLNRLTSFITCMLDLSFRPGPEDEPFEKACDRLEDDWMGMQQRIRTRCATEDQAGFEHSDLEPIDTGRKAARRWLEEYLQSRGRRHTVWESAAFDVPFWKEEDAEKNRKEGSKVVEATKEDVRPLVTEDPQVVDFWAGAQTTAVGPGKPQVLKLPPLSRDALRDYFVHAIFYSTAVHEILGNILLDVSVPTTVSTRILPQKWFGKTRPPQATIQEWFRISCTCAATTTLPKPKLLPEMERQAAAFRAAAASSSDAGAVADANTSADILESFARDLGTISDMIVRDHHMGNGGEFYERNSIPARRGKVHASFGQFDPRRLEVSVSL